MTKHPLPGIRVLRQRLFMTQAQLAKKAGVTQGYIGQLERGLKTNPSLAAMRRIAAALNVPARILLTVLEAKGDLR